MGTFFIIDLQLVGTRFRIYGTRFKKMYFKLFRDLTDFFLLERNNCNKLQKVGTIYALWFKLYVDIQLTHH